MTRYFFAALVLASVLSASVQAAILPPESALERAEIGNVPDRNGNDAVVWIRFVINIKPQEDLMMPDIHAFRIRLDAGQFFLPAPTGSVEVSPVEPDGILLSGHQYKLTVGASQYTDWLPEQAFASRFVLESALLPAADRTLIRWTPTIDGLPYQSPFFTLHGGGIVPEPATFSILGLSMIGLIRRPRKG